jgi:hypothetical protein
MWALNRSAGCLAQLVERRPYKANVSGSTPLAPTNNHRISSQIVKSASFLALFHFDENKFMLLRLLGKIEK